MEQENKSKMKTMLDLIYSIKNENPLIFSEQIIKQLDNLLEGFAGENIEKDQFFKLITFLKQVILNLINEVKKGEIVSELAIKKYRDEASKLALKIKSKIEMIEKNNKAEKLSYLEKIDNLMKKINELTEENIKNKTKINELTEENIKYKKNINELSEENIKYKKNINELTEENMFGIKNRDNYKSIIYILLIYYGFDFKEIGGSIYNLINDEKIKVQEIKSILKDAFKAMFYHREYAHEANTKGIMKELFPRSKLMIEDDLINNIKDLLFRYEQNKFLNDLEYEKEIESDINELSKRIKELKLNVE